VRDGNTLYFYSTRGFVRMGFDGTPQWIGRGRVDESFGRDAVGGSGVNGWHDETNNLICWAASGGTSIYTYSPALDEWAEISDRGNTYYAYTSRLDSKFNTKNGTTFYYKSQGSDGNLYGLTDFDDIEVPVFQSGIVQPFFGRRSALYEAWPDTNFDTSSDNSPTLGGATLNNLDGDSIGINPTTTNISKHATEKYWQVRDREGRYWVFYLTDSGTNATQNAYKGVRFTRWARRGKW